MSSTYSPDLRIELITTGEQAGVWGVTTNSNLSQVIEQAIAGYVSVAVTSADQALTYTNGGASTGAANQSVYAMIALTTSLSTAFRIYVPPSSKMYTFYNSATKSATIYNSTSIGNTTAAGTGAIIPAGSSLTVWSDGTNVRPQIYNNWDLGAGFTTAAQRYIQVTNASTDAAASAVVSTRSDVQNLQILATSSAAAPASGIPLAGKASLYAVGGAGSSGLQIWDNSNAPQIDFIVGGASSAVTSATILSDGKWAVNKRLTMYDDLYVASGKAFQIFNTANSAYVGLSFSGTTLTATSNFDAGTFNPISAVRYVRALNASSATTASASVYSQSDVQILQVLSNSSTTSSSSGIPLAGKASLYAAGGAGSSGLQIWDNSNAPQIDFIVGVASSAATSATINSSGNWVFNSKTISGATWNGVVIGADYGGTGNGFFAVSGPASSTKTFTFPNASATVLTDNAVVTSAQGGTGVNNSYTLTISGANRTLDQSVANGASPTFGTLTANTFVPASGTAPTNGMYLSGTNTVSIAGNSLRTASFTSANNFDVGTSNTTNAVRYVRALNASSATTASASVYSQSDVQILQVLSNSSTTSSSSGIPLAGKASLYAAGGAGSSGLQIWDNSNAPQIDLIVGLTVAETVNSSGAITRPVQPAFSANNLSAQNNVIGTSTTWYTVILNNELFDRANNFNNSTYTFTAPVTGLYNFTAFVNVTDANATGAPAIELRILTTSRSYTICVLGGDSLATLPSACSVQGAVLAAMTAGDTAVLQIRAPYGTSAVADLSTVLFTGYLVA